MSFLTQSHQVFFQASSLSNSFNLPRHTTFDLVIIIFLFKPSQPILFDHHPIDNCHTIIHHKSQCGVLVSHHAHRQNIDMTMIWVHMAWTCYNFPLTTIMIIPCHCLSPYMNT